MTKCCLLTCISLDCCYGAGPLIARPRPPTPPPPYSYSSSQENSPPESISSEVALTRVHIPLPSDPRNAPIDHIKEQVDTAVISAKNIQNFLGGLEEKAGAQILSTSEMDDLYVQLMTLERWEYSGLGAQIGEMGSEIDALKIKGKCPGQRISDLAIILETLESNMSDLWLGIYDLKKRLLEMLNFNRASSRLDVPELIQEFQKQHPRPPQRYYCESSDDHSIDAQASEDELEAPSIITVNGNGLTHMKLEGMETAEAEADADAEDIIFRESLMKKISEAEERIERLKEERDKTKAELNEWARKQVKIEDESVAKAIRLSLL